MPGYQTSNIVTVLTELSPDINVVREIKGGFPDGLAQNAEHCVNVAFGFML
jgi:hypothetical protein